MKRTILTVASLFATAATAPAQPRPREPMDEAIDRGLAYLRQVQNRDGSWSTEPGFGPFGGGPRGNAGAAGGDPAVTALCVMAFLSAGKVPGEGTDGTAVERGVRFVMSRQQKGRAFANDARSGGGTEMYYHGICTLMLAEAAGMTDGKLADELKLRLEDAVNVILRGQRQNAGRDTGGWRYQVVSQQNDSDLSVTGWQLMALRAAKNVGCDVPAERIQAAVDYVLRCHDSSTGGFRYTTQGRVTVPCTGTGILALELCGKEFHLSEPALRAGSYILNPNNQLQPSQPHFFYGVYYTSQGMFQLGQNYWKSYRPKLHMLLLRQQGPQQNGAWYGNGSDDRNYGPTYCTPMAILVLTVEYRLLPIYQRFEEPKERDGK